MRAAVIENDVVVNVIIVHDLSFPVGEGRELIAAENNTAEIGWVRQPDGTFAPPEQEN